MEKSHLAIGLFLTLGLILAFNSVALASELGAPTLNSNLSPENNENISDNRPSFSWDGAKDNEENYRLVIDDSKFADSDNEYDNRIPKDTTTIDNIENALADGVWYWKVAAENFRGGVDNEKWSNTWNFRVDTDAPSAPSLSSPNNNTNTNDTTPTLKWNSVSEDSRPVLYYVAVSDNSQFPYENDNSGWISDNKYTIPSENSLSNDNWYWHVRAKDNAGNEGENSGWWKFQVDNLLPTLISPSDGKNTTENRPTFKWDNVVVADNYELQIDSGSTYDNDNITDNQHQLPSGNALPDGSHSWRVRGHKGGDTSVFSSSWSFRVDTLAPSAPSLVSPSAGENINDNTPNLDWQTVAENSTPVYYRCYVSDNSQFPYDNYDSGWVTDDNYQISSELTENTWYWRVQAKDNLGNSGENSSVQSFQVDVTSPTISGITESSIGQNSATIEWTTDEPADSEVEYGKTTSYGSTNSSSSLVTSHSVTLSNLDPDNTYHYRVKSTDNAGNTTTSSDYEFTTLPLQKPTSSVDNIDNDWLNSSSFSITATASDNDGTVENVTLYYRYQENAEASWGSWTSFGVDTSSDWEWTFDTPENDGIYEFYTRASDDDNQMEDAPSSADDNVGIDTSPPTISLVQINGDNTIATYVDVTISISALDNDSGLSEVRFKQDNKTWDNWESFENEKSYSLSLPEGTKTVYVKVKNNAGLTSTVLDNSIILENATFSESLGSIAENSNDLADFSNQGLQVTSVRLYAKKSVSGAKVDLQISKTKPSEIKADDPAPVNYYFNVKTNAPTDNLSKIDIEFTVKKSWLENQGLDSGDVKLWKLNDGWEQISTVGAGENTTHVSYSVTVSSLSWFAVTGESAGGGIGLIWIAIIAAAAIIIVILVLNREKIQGSGLPRSSGGL